MDRVIVSEDKDMQTLPNVKIWRQDKLVETTAESAENFWLYQTLMGDSTDGYKGCPGCGPKSAEAILQKAGDPWRSEEHTSELPSLMRISSAVFCLKTNK